ncbi:MULTISPECIES: hypothetical protein [Myxococcus]|uniref:hypothetical protein n=1 Tax=Myxococcus TaxID=32 RepID=UPI00142F3033|nr:MULTISPECIES: hypothetical protein [Myxococcus]NOJ51989.1 hypothetical protein [Myxococcus xanthus]QPM82912.1 hypothetical protein I5Q59_17275 [Myxococcus xanthus]QVW65218.1 hypothetical protein JTM82_22620 [Myxococcus xanthus DZ2]UEO01714.1 hypothetical protein K1515_20170 [Myxococcus xanthus DZ2]UYI18099.1 hypothetical protein N3T43_17830 [Myxococcus xanthus]
MPTNQASPNNDYREHLESKISNLNMEKIQNTITQDGTPDPDHNPTTDLTNLISLLKLIASIDISNTPSKTSKELRSRTHSAITTLTTPSSRRTPTNTTPPESYSQEISNQYNTLYRVAAPIIALEMQRSPNIESTQSKLENELVAVKKTRVECEQLADDLKKLSIDTVIARQSEHFANEAVEHKDSAAKWLIGVTATATIIAAIAWFASVNTPAALVQGSMPLTIFAYAPRFLVLSVAFYALSLCARNYRTSRHNYIVNRHRSVALSTFGVFAASAANERVKDAILAQAASTIFSPQPSGYSVEQAEPLPQATAVELLQRISPK